MSDLGKQLFLTSRDQYEAAIRWAFVLVIIGVAAHAMIFSRAVEIQKELHAKRTALENLSSMNEVADGLPEKVASFNAMVTEQKKRVDDVTTAWVGDLKFRIAQLNALLTPEYRGVAPAEEFGPSLQSPVQQIQQDNVQRFGGRVLDVQEELRKKLEKVGLAEQLDRAQDFSERFDLVVRFVNEHIIPASFERLNRQWAVPDTLTEDAEELKQAVHALETVTESPLLSRALQSEQLERLKNETEGLGELRSKIDSTLTALKSIRFVPPEEDDWWWSVEGKGEERVNMAAGAKELVQRIGGLQESELVGAIAELRRAAKRQEEATKSLNKELRELEQQLRQGTTELAGMGIGWIPIGGDIGGFVRHFPLLLGLLLAVVVVWPTYRRISLVRAIRLLSPEDADEGSRRLLWQEYGPPTTVLGWALLAGALVGYGWIGLATTGAAGSPLEGAWGAVTSGVGGAIVFTVALAYRVYALRRVQRLNSPHADL